MSWYDGWGGLMVVIDDDKKVVVVVVVVEVWEGMLVGFGIGFIVVFVIWVLGEWVVEGLIICVVVIFDVFGRFVCDVGIDVVDFVGIVWVDLIIDGVDEIDLWLFVIKGVGGVMLCEKIVVVSLVWMVVIVDGLKCVGVIGVVKLLVEVLLFVFGYVMGVLEEIGGVLVVCDKYWMD